MIAAPFKKEQNKKQSKSVIRAICRRCCIKRKNVRYTTGRWQKKPHWQRQAKDHFTHKTMLEKKWKINSKINKHLKNNYKRKTQDVMHKSLEVI